MGRRKTIHGPEPFQLGRYRLEAPDGVGQDNREAQKAVGFESRLEEEEQQNREQRSEELRVTRKKSVRFREAEGRKRSEEDEAEEEEEEEMEVPNIRKRRRRVEDQLKQLVGKVNAWARDVRKGK